MNNGDNGDIMAINKGDLKVDNGANGDLKNLIDYKLNILFLES